MRYIYYVLPVIATAIFKILNLKPFGALICLLSAFFSPILISPNVTNPNTLSVLFILSTVYLICSDAKQKKENSIFIKYNCFYEKNKLPPWLSFFFCIIGIIVSILKVIELLFWD